MTGTPDDKMAESGPLPEFRELLERYAEEIRRCRYGSFRGLIKDGKIVLFALEHEWRPQKEAGRRRKQGEDLGGLSHTRG